MILCILSEAITVLRQNMNGPHFRMSAARSCFSLVWETEAPGRLTGRSRPIQSQPFHLTCRLARKYRYGLGCRTLPSAFFRRMVVAEASPPQAVRNRDGARVKARILFFIKISPFRNVILRRNYVCIVPKWVIPVNGSSAFIRSLF